MFGRDPYRVSRLFVDAVNARDIAAIDPMIHEDCRFIDSRGYRLEGRELCLEVMGRFFEVEPEYRIHVETMSRSGEDVLLRGHVTARDPRLRLATLWRARSDEQQMREWQGYSIVGAPPLARILAGKRAVAPTDGF